jgi:hypothetical protein
MKDLKAFEALIDRWVTIQNFAAKDAVGLKIELLALTLDKLKHARKQKGEQITFEEFEQSMLLADIDRLVVAAPEHVTQLGTGTEPIRLQSPLLLFLLIHHRERFEVLRIIELFIEKIWGGLTFLDFKKTRTGVTRCYTNTRFAAHVLRDYGLLKFTQKEAYKTWELSLAGFLVAADLLDTKRKDGMSWKIPHHKKQENFDLLPEIRCACDKITTYDQFVGRLASLCQPDVSVFKTFDAALKKAFALLPGYWATLKNPNLTQQERREASLGRVKQLEHEGITDAFYAEFSECIKINDLLARIPPAPKQDDLFG